MNTHTKLVSALTVALLALGCNPQTDNSASQNQTASPAAQKGGSPLREADVASLKQFGASLNDAMQRGDYATAANMYTEDCVRYPPDGPAIRGRDAVQKDWQSLAVDTKEWVYTSEGLVGSGDVAYEKGRWKWTVTPTGQANAPPSTVSGDCVTIFARQPDGSWKIAAEAFSVHQLAGASRKITELGARK
jgi:ketosteroid isomerase-like protein